MFELAQNAATIVIVRDSGGIADRVADGQEWNRGSVRDAPGLDERDRILVELPAQLENEAGFPHAWFPRDADDLSGAALRVRKELEERLELAFAADEGREVQLLDVVDPGAAPTEPEHAVRLHRALLDHDLLGGFELEVAVQELGGVGTHEDVARLGRRLEPRRQDGRVAEGGVVGPQVITDLADHDETGVDPDAHGDLLLERALVPDERVAYAERG